jgi:alkanesulfonate monooxygenase SsuD/methylene tetrahydromethanopterin reductase-like flavin-dependent oxidoreductase (luciferase family)
VRQGFGVAATVPHDVLRELAGELRRLGYDDAWSNDLGAGSNGDGLAALTALGGNRGAGTDATGLRLGLGVAALDRRSPGVLADSVEAYGLTGHELLLGVGAGFSSSPLRIVREGIAELRELLAGSGSVRIGIAAMGPRMCRLGGETADFVLLNWMTPERIRWARRHMEEGARDAGRDPASVGVAAYVRVAVGSDAAERLAAESARYASMPHYGRHFKAMHVEPASVGIAAQDPADVTTRLAPYRETLDTLVIRGLPNEPTLAAHLEIARAAA